MIGYSMNPRQLIDEFNQMADTAHAKAFITIGVEIQEKEITVLQNYIGDLIELKTKFISQQMEAEANLIFCIVGSLRAVQYELQMLVNLKKDKMAEAWGNLVYAQTVLGPVIRNYPLENADPVTGYLDRLASYEKLLFPNMYFHSVGYIIKEARCSICKQDPEDCDHIKGKLYMGELCSRHIVKADLLEASLVKNPANKLCRTLSIQTGGKTIDLLTYREIKNDPLEHGEKPDHAS
ncbi:MAG: hypothetical protein EOO90_26545 [Pedobacter sp.]|nr:MAG: hypothetical protein EOO90_26545 [Pedobacter sp.]